MTCREFVEFLRHYVSRELPDSQLARFEEHLAECPSCAAYMSTYLETVRLGKAAFSELDEELPDDVPEELVEAILSAKKRRD